VPQQEVQQVELAQRQGHHLLVAQQFAPHGVQPEGTEAQLAGRGRRRAELLDAAEQRTDARHQLQHRERLGQVVVGAQLQAQHAVRLGRARGEHDHRHAGVAFTQVATDFPAVGSRQHQVQQHQVPALAVDGRHGVAAIGLAVQAKAGFLEVQAQRLRDGIVVFHQQQLLAHARDVRAAAKARPRCHWTRTGGRRSGAGHGARAVVGPATARQESDAQQACRQHRQAAGFRHR
jgi:hypothetical protein